MPDSKPILDPSRELPAPHDMQLPMTHYQNLPKPEIIHSHGWLKWVLLGSMILVGLSGAGLVYLQNTTQPTPPELAIPTKTTPEPTSSETASWNTYKDKKDRFTFKYPKGWLVSNGEAQADGSWERIDIMLEDNPNDFTRPDIAVIITQDTEEIIVADILKQGGIFEENETYGELKGKLYEATSSATTHTVQYRLDFIVPVKEKNYWFRLFTTPEQKKEHEELFEDFLSSFSFTKERAVNITLPRPSGQDPAVVELAKEDLAKKLKIKKENISVNSVNDVEWSDGSLGCPKPGMVYTQAIVPGYRLVLRAMNNSYTYHTDTNTQVIQCDNAILLE